MAFSVIDLFDWIGLEFGFQLSAYSKDLSKRVITTMTAKVARDSTSEVTRFTGSLVQ